MDSKLRAKVLTMAAATLGLSMVGGCAKKAPEAPEAGEQAAGAEHSCGGGSCGANKAEGAAEGATEAPAEGAPAEGAAEGGGESSCGGGSCGGKK